jgi:hypothetical protein
MRRRRSSQACHWQTSATARNQDDVEVERVRIPQIEPRPIVYKAIALPLSKWWGYVPSSASMLTASMKIFTACSATKLRNVNSRQRSKKAMAFV